MTAYADAIAKPPRTLTELEQKLILRTTGEHRDGFRDHVLISLALGTGLREHEPTRRPERVTSASGWTARRMKDCPDDGSTTARSAASSTT